MPSKKKNKRGKREQRRARYNQNKKEGTVMKENISGTANSTVAAEAAGMAMEAAEEVAAEVTASGVEEVDTEVVEKEAECLNREDKEVDNIKTEDVTVTKEASHKLYIQYNDLEFSDELMFEAAVNAYCNEYGKDKSSVEAVNLYVKPQEGKAYYVINNDAEKTGSIDL